jgi:hypothetical protein
MATATRNGSARDFDFLLGSWKVHNRLRRTWLAGVDEWDEFEATSAARPILEGLGNVDEYRTDYAGGSVGMALRLFDPKRRVWFIYWATTKRPGLLDPPVAGAIDGDSGVFEGDDTFDGRPILVRFVWSRVSSGTPRWEQAFSDDGGETWETNWVMDFTRNGETS